MEAYKQEFIKFILVSAIDAISKSCVMIIQILSAKIK